MGELIGDKFTVAHIQRAKALAMRVGDRPTMLRDGKEYYKFPLFGGAVSIPPSLYDRAEALGYDMREFVRSEPIPYFTANVKD